MDKDVLEKFAETKANLAKLKAETSEDETIPASLFFTIFDAMVHNFEGMAKEIEELRSKEKE